LGQRLTCDLVRLHCKFQFLSRNSVRWDYGSVCCALRVVMVSIPQSEFCPLGLRQYFVILIIIFVSIPQSEFCPLGHRQGHVGNFRSYVSIPQSEFCPLGHTIKGHIDGVPIYVSIPQSEFCPLGHIGVSFVIVFKFCVSIPQSEFCPLGHKFNRQLSNDATSFNSSVGILSVGTYRNGILRRIRQ